MEKLKIYAKTVEQEALDQINQMNQCEAYKDCVVRIMPDCHAGAGCTIGTVIAVKDRVVPNTVGVDIGCGMLVIQLGNIEVDLEKLDKVINEHVPSGFNIRETPYTDFVKLDFLGCLSVIDKNMALRSLGTLGGGNHFIEVDVDEANNKYLVIHSGSRNLGVRVCNYYQNKAVEYCSCKKADYQPIIDQLKAEGRQKEIPEIIKKYKQPKVPKELCYLEGDLFFSYFGDMRICQEYARINRACIATVILENMGWPNGAWFETVHNYIDVEQNILRKGAVSAQAGQKLIIPMNMKDGSLICTGKGNIDWLNSAPHGAGRLMSRAKAKETLNMEDFVKSMEGIYTTSVCKETIDEAPMVYKPTQEIIECIKDTVEINYIIKPIYNFKAKEQGNKFKK